MVESIERITFFAGIDNTSDITKLSMRGEKAYCRELTNVDIDDEGMLHRRFGYAPSPVLSGSDIHSFWSNGKTALFVDGTNFKRLLDDFTSETLVTGIMPGAKMVYIDVHGTVYWSNNSLVGYVFNNVSYPFPDPSQAFKKRMVGGQVLEFFNSRLYAAHDHILYYSDATILTRMDNRKNAKVFPGRITMVKAVKDGMYVSANQRTYFLAGKDPDDFVLEQVLDAEAIIGSAITIEGDSAGEFGLASTIYFLTQYGPYKGLPGGRLVELQGGLFSPESDIECATSMLKFDRGFQQYLTIYQLNAGIGAADAPLRLVGPVISGGD